MARRYGHKEPSKKVLVTREVEQYSNALRQASGLARMDGATVVVWKRELGRFVNYAVVGEGVNPGADYVPLVKVAPVAQLSDELPVDTTNILVKE